MFAFTGVQYFFLFLAFYKKAYNKNTNNRSKVDKKLVEANNNVVDSKLEWVACWNSYLNLHFSNCTWMQGVKGIKNILIT